MRHKRSVLDNPFDVREKIKYAAIEGGSLTLLGLMKYNSNTDEFRMTELATILSGGVVEARRQL